MILLLMGTAWIWSRDGRDRQVPCHHTSDLKCEDHDQWATTTQKESVERRVEVALKHTTLRPESDWNALNGWVVGRYNRHWVREKQKRLDMVAG